MNERQQPASRDYQKYEMHNSANYADHRVMSICFLRISEEIDALKAELKAQKALLLQSFPAGIEPTFKV